MLSLPPAVRIFVATQPTSMHLSFDRLAALAREVFVIEHVRFKYACKACEERVVTSPLPAQPIDKGRPGPGLLAQVITAKYADHIPLNRQVDIFARHGVDLARQTLCDWVGASADLLRPVYDDVRASVLSSKVVQTDDTPVPVLDATRTQTREGRLWVYVGAQRPTDIVYDYTPTHSRAGPRDFLGDFCGYLQADAYAGYDALYATGRVTEVGCWAHARRYFWDAKPPTRRARCWRWVSSSSCIASKPRRRT